MAEQDMDSGQNLEGTAGASTSASSQGAGGKPGSIDVTRLESAIKSLTEQVGALQSDKDRGVHKALKGYEDLRSKIAELEQLKKRGLGDDEAFAELEFRDSVRQLKNQLGKPDSEVSAAPRDKVDDGAEVASKLNVLSQYGIDPNEVVVNQWNSLKGDAFELAVARYAKGKPKPDVSDVSALAAGGARAAGADASTQEYLKEMSNARGKGYKAGDEIKAKYRKLGVPVDDILITA